MMQHPGFLGHDTLYCNDCGGQVDPLKARIQSKQKGTWRCSRCLTRFTQLHRAFGGWPPQGFASLTDEDRKQFYTDIGDAVGQQNVKERAERMLIDDQQGLDSSPFILLFLRPLSLP